MKAEVKKIEDGKALVVVTVAANEIDSKIKETYSDFAKKYNFPGFRKGRAPRPVIDNSLGKEAVAATVTDAVINDNLPLAIDELDLYTMSKPELADQGTFVKEGEDFVFEATVSVVPDFTLSSYGPVTVDILDEKVSDEELEEQISSVLESYATLEEDTKAKKIPAEGYCKLKVAATNESGKSIDSLSANEKMFMLGAGLMPAPFDEAIAGLKVGDKKDISVNIKEHRGMFTDALAQDNEILNMSVEVLAILKNQKPELTDEWVASNLSMESVADFKAKVKENFDAEKKRAIASMKESQCLMALEELLVGEAPEELLTASKQELLQSFFRQLQEDSMTFDEYLSRANITPEIFQEDLREQATSNVIQDLALDAYAKKAKIDATPEDITNEFLKSGAEDPVALQKEWTDSGQLNLLRRGIRRSKAASEIMDKAKVNIITKEQFEEKVAKVKKEREAKRKDVAKAKKDTAKPNAKNAASTAKPASKPAAKKTTSTAKKTATATKPAAKKTASTAKPAAKKSTAASKATSKTSAKKSDAE